MSTDDMAARAAGAAQSPPAHGGTWREVVNTDAHEYGGSGVGNLGVVTGTDTPWGGRPASAELTLPPLAGLWLAPE